MHRRDLRNKSAAAMAHSTSYDDDTPLNSSDDDDYRNNYNLRPRRTASPRSSTPLTRRSATIPPSPLRRRAPPSARAPPARPKRTRPRSRASPAHPAIPSASALAKSSAGFVWDILGLVVWLVRKPLMWGVALVLLYTLCCMLVVWARNSVYLALSPVCAVPGVSSLGFPFCDDSGGGGYSLWGWGGGGAASDGSHMDGNEFPKLMKLQTSFEELLEDSVGGTVMARDLKNSEIAVRDLNSLVKHSKLEARCGRLTPELGLC